MSLAGGNTPRLCVATQTYKPVPSCFTRFGRVSVACGRLLRDLREFKILVFPEVSSNLRTPRPLRTAARCVEIPIASEGSSSLLK